VKAPWSVGPAHWAALNGHLHILEYLFERKFDQFDVLACRNAAMDGHFDSFFLKVLARNRQSALEL
jgi:hypothetical protein